MFGCATVGIGLMVAPPYCANSIIVSQEWGIMSYYHYIENNIERHSLVIHMYSFVIYMYSFVIHMYVQLQHNIHNSFKISLLRAGVSLPVPCHHDVLCACIMKALKWSLLQYIYFIS